MPKLSDPLGIRSVVLPNRLWFPPVARDLATEDGAVTDENVDAYRRLASGGVGTVVVEHCYIHPHGRFSSRQIGVDREARVPGLKRIADEIRRSGAVPILQVSFAGARTLDGRRIGPSPVPLPGETETPTELSTAEIPGLVAAFATAVRRARDAGFAGAEIHGAHGFLISEFLSPLTNQRGDAYGGGLENRARLALEVVQAARAHARDDFLIGFRLGATDDLPGGLTVEEGRRVAARLQEAGVDILSISGGLCGSRPARREGVQGYFVREAAEIRKAVSVPVVGVGGITEPSAARAAVEDGAVDLIAVGRQLVADPGWARRALAG